MTVLWIVVIIGGLIVVGVCVERAWWVRWQERGASKVLALLEDLQRTMEGNAQVAALPEYVTDWQSKLEYMEVQFEQQCSALRGENELWLTRTVVGERAQRVLYDYERAVAVVRRMQALLSRRALQE